MRIHYEEKTFESYFNAELSRRGIFFFPPGQVQEGSMGADSVAMSHSRWLWRKLGHPYWFAVPFKGAPYRQIAEEMEDYLERVITDVPNISGNIFFQYKRSEYMVLKSAGEWANWNQPYYRYEIYQEQHKLLEHLHQTFGSDVLIVYAAPAVQDVNELVDLHKTQKIIARTNFRPAHELSGHRRNTFIEPGGHSWACSDPARLEVFDFEEAVAQLRPEGKDSISTLLGIGQRVEQALRESAYRRSFEVLVQLYSASELSDRTPLLKTYATMAILREICGIQWVAVQRSDA